VEELIQARVFIGTKLPEGLVAPCENCEEASAMALREEEEIQITSEATGTDPRAILAKPDQIKCISEDKTLEVQLPLRRRHVWDDLISATS
jgi:hypothetical protein